jgi:hypothetical protein
MKDFGEFSYLSRASLVYRMYLLRRNGDTSH